MQLEVSAGGVLFKDDEVLLVKNPSEVWTFPKGLIEEGESPEEAAVREVKEETGVLGKIVTPLGSVEYYYTREGQRIKKKVYYYLMKYVEGEPKPSWEVLDARFFPKHQVLNLLKYKGDIYIFKKALFSPDFTKDL
ncbi:NUDIX hydrolase [Thermocrinis minervae]|uniref:8-oxo-dGTP diphosphatase n=1 Tax=Thermocrinis minervae TaxID=381751 RepID=A0A1M6TLR4_9AQUI|nr:NUDIX hydrolase [Thermocrinis minervae]SHK57718.1 8-oxo-dGTP diphosphatase [Thermocrinis minervae]